MEGKPVYCLHSVESIKVQCSVRQREHLGEEWEHLQNICTSTVPVQPSVVLRKPEELRMPVSLLGRRARLPDAELITVGRRCTHSDRLNNCLLCLKENCLSFCILKEKKRIRLKEIINKRKANADWCYQ